MGQIIAGRFDVHENAEYVYQALQEAGFEAASLSIFFVNPHGQHATSPIGGDENASAGAKGAGTGAWAGAGAGAAAGAAAGSVAGPAGAVIGGGVGAYTGSLAGAVHVAVNVSDSDAQQAIDLLRKHQAQDIEQAEGNLQNGDWVDFNPALAVRLV